MKLTALIPLLSFIINHALTINILTKHKRHYIYYSTLLFMTSLSITLAIAFLLWSFTTYDMLLFLTKLQVLFWLPLGIYFLNYIYDLIEIKRPKAFFVVFILTILFSAAAAFTSDLVPGIVVESVVPRPIHSIGFIIGLTLFLVIPALYAFYLLFKNISEIKHKTPVFLRYLFLVSISVLLFSAVFLFYLPFILERQLTSIGTNIVLPISITMFFTTKYINLTSIDNKSTAKFLFNEISDVIILLDDNHFIIQINPAACQFFNINEKEALDLHISQILISSTYSPEHIYFDQRMILEIKEEEVPVMLKQTALKSWKEKVYGKLILIKPPFREKNSLIGTIQKVFE
jgi:PAS domain-containing protein